MTSCYSAARYESAPEYDDTYPDWTAEIADSAIAEVAFTVDVTAPAN